MAEYVLKAETVRRAYVHTATRGIPLPSRTADEERMLAGIRFDRWLAAEIRRAKAEGWDEGYAMGQVDYKCAAENPHREENADG